MNVTKNITTVTCPHCNHTTTTDVSLDGLAAGQKLVCEKCGKEIVIDRSALASAEKMLENLPIQDILNKATVSETSLSLSCPHCNTMSSYKLSLEAACRWPEGLLFKLRQGNSGRPGEAAKGRGYSQRAENPHGGRQDRDTRRGWEQSRHPDDNKNIQPELKRYNRSRRRRRGRLGRNPSGDRRPDDSPRHRAERGMLRGVGDAFFSNGYCFNP